MPRLGGPASPQKVDPYTCRHEVDFDLLRSQRKPKGKIRWVAECGKCGTLVGLDAVLTRLFADHRRLKQRVQALERRDDPDAE